MDALKSTEHGQDGQANTEAGTDNPLLKTGAATASSAVEKWYDKHVEAEVETNKVETMNDVADRAKKPVDTKPVVRTTADERKGNAGPGHAPQGSRRKPSGRRNAGRYSVSYQMALSPTRGKTAATPQQGAGSTSNKAKDQLSRPRRPGSAPVSSQPDLAGSAQPATRTVPPVANPENPIPENSRGAAASQAVSQAASASPEQSVPDARKGIANGAEQSDRESSARTGGDPRVADIAAAQPKAVPAEVPEVALSATEPADHDADSKEDTNVAVLPGPPDDVAPPFTARVDLEKPDHAGYRAYIWTGLLLLFLGVGGFVLWASLAPLKSGSMAPGVVKVAGERKVVQHLEGGIIRDILANEGDTVKAGQVIVRLDNSKAVAALESQEATYNALRVKRARLLAERDGLPEMQIPADLETAAASNAEIKELIAGEKRLFAARKASIEDQLKVYSSWSAGYKTEIEGLQAQRTAARRQLFHINDELKSVQTLYDKGVIDKPRLLRLKRTAAGLTGEIGSYTSNIARTEQKGGEAQLRAVALKTQREEEVSKDLQQVEVDLLSLRDRLPALKDTVKRLDIKAPISGRVVNLRFHTAGGVIPPSTPIMEIVPEGGKLIVEARIKPTDIDIIVPGMEAQVQLTAYSTRSTPPVAGHVMQVSADRVEDPKTGEAYYAAFIEIDQDALRQLTDVKLYPGMPASVQIVAGERTPIDYFLSPLEAGMRRGWLEE